METYVWRIFRELKPNPNIKYINRCCEFCDIILEDIKSEICQEMNVVIRNVVIGQEDWGWYLELQKDDVFYELDISYQETDDEKVHLFCVTIEADKIEKGFVLNRKTAAKSEREKFAERVKKIARKKMIEISEE